MTAPDVDDVLRDTLSSLHLRLSRYTYPLFALDSRARPDLYASCVVFECDGTPVLVTAAHAVFEILQAGSAVYVGGKHILQLPNSFERSSTDGADPLDIAAVPCPRHLLDSGEIEVLPQADTTLGRDLSDSRIRCIHGYPCSKNRQTQRIDAASRSFTRYAFTYAGLSAESDARYAAFKKDPTIHADLVYENTGHNETGIQLLRPPHPKGISGAGLWIIPRAANLMPLNTAYLGGIAVEYHQRESLVFATRIEHVVDFIKTQVLR